MTVFDIQDDPFQRALILYYIIVAFTPVHYLMYPHSWNSGSDDCPSAEVQGFDPSVCRERGSPNRVWVFLRLLIIHGGTLKSMFSRKGVIEKGPGGSIPHTLR